MCIETLLLRCLNEIFLLKFGLKRGNLITKFHFYVKLSTERDYYILINNHHS